MQLSWKTHCHQNITHDTTKPVANIIVYIHMFNMFKKEFDDVHVQPWSKQIYEQVWLSYTQSVQISSLHPTWNLIIQDKKPNLFQAPFYYISVGLFILHLWISYRTFICKCSKSVLFARMGLNVAQAIDAKLKLPVNQG